MKIEKISDNQIRCTLTGEDLSSRDIRLSELTYGSEKARRLFNDMLQEAHYEVGFNSDGFPLMIEAIPTSPDSIILNITRVEDPEELDTRYSRFTKSEPETDQKLPESADEILDLFNKIKNAAKAMGDQSSSAQEKPSDSGSPDPVPQGTSAPVSLVRRFDFATLDDVILAAGELGGFYKGQNALYRNAGNGAAYSLILHQSGQSAKTFNKVCNILAEYGQSHPCTKAGEAYLKEHGDVLIRASALQKLRQISG